MTTINGIILKPCPFCGSERQTVLLVSILPSIFCVGCEYCGSNGPGRQEETAAIEAWNRRTPEPDEYPMAKPKRTWTAIVKATIAPTYESPASDSMRKLAETVANWEKRNPPVTIPELAANDLAASVAGFKPETDYE
jgi:Lar family restriction alleviation protein